MPIDLQVHKTLNLCDFYRGKLQAGYKTHAKQNCPRAFLETYIQIHSYNFE